MEPAGNTLVNLLCRALELKEKKEKLYQEAMASCADDVGRQTFRILYEAEQEHEKALSHIRRELEAGKDWTAACRYEPAEQNLLDRLAQKITLDKDRLPEACTDEIQALDAGVQLEEACVRLFEDEMQHVTDPSQKEFLRRLAAEEREHRRLLQDLKFFYTDPQGWFMEKSRARLDGAGAVT